MPGSSAAWTLTIIATVTGVMGALLLTVGDPIMQAFFDSPLWASDTTYGSNLLGWFVDAWALIGFVILTGIMFLVWIETRQPT